jgi:hypothetical protein
VACSGVAPSGGGSVRRWLGPGVARCGGGSVRGGSVRRVAPSGGGSVRRLARSGDGSVWGRLGRGFRCRRGPPDRPWRLSRCTVSHSPRQSEPAGVRIRCGCLVHAARCAWLRHPRLNATAPVGGYTRRGIAQRAAMPRRCRPGACPHQISAGHLPSPDQRPDGHHWVRAGVWAGAIVRLCDVCAGRGYASRGREPPGRGLDAAGAV